MKKLLLLGLFFCLQMHDVSASNDLFMRFPRISCQCIFSVGCVSAGINMIYNGKGLTQDPLDVKKIADGISLIALGSIVGVYTAIEYREIRKRYISGFYYDGDKDPREIKKKLDAILPQKNTVSNSSQIASNGSGTGTGRELNQVEKIV